MLELPEDYVPTRQQAHAVGLLTAWKTMKLLDLPIDTFADEVNAGRLEVAARFNNAPCFSLEAIDVNKRSRHARPAEPEAVTPGRTL